MDSILPLYFFYFSISFIVNSYLLNLGQINCAIIKSFQQPWENIKNFTFWPVSFLGFEKIIKSTQWPKAAPLWAGVSRP